MELATRSRATGLTPDARARLEGFLRLHLQDFSGPIEVDALQGGLSNLTWRVREASGNTFVIRQVPIGVQVSGAYDIAREFEFTSRLFRAWPRLPEPLALCADSSVLGSCFTVTRYVPGVPFNDESAPEQVAATCKNFVECQADLHGLDATKIGLTDKALDPHFCRRQIANAIRRNEAATRQSDPLFDELILQLLASAPITTRLAPTHNDYRFGNVIFDEGGSVRAVLDWETATVGDPLLDFGTTLAYWVEASDPPAARYNIMSPGLLSGAPTRETLLEAYLARTGFDAGDMAWYEAFACLRLVVVIRQLMARDSNSTSPLTDGSEWAQSLLARAEARVRRWT